MQLARTFPILLSSVLELCRATIITWTSREKLSPSAFPFVPFGLDEFECVDPVVLFDDEETCPWVACSHFSRSSANRENRGCLRKEAN